MNHDPKRPERKLPRVTLLRRFSPLFALALLAAPQAWAGVFPVRCNTGGDQMGYTIATGGDFDGDGIGDLAISAPCTWIRGNANAGKVTVFSGKTGRRMYTVRGGQANEWLGAGLAFVGDINDDGRDDLAVGSPGFDVQPEAPDPLNPPPVLGKAGKVVIYRQPKPHRLRKVLGQTADAGFGVTIARLGDITGDGRGDYSVAAPDDKITGGNARKGKVYVISGNTSSEILGIFEGQTSDEDFGSSLADGADLNGDQTNDIVAGSGAANIQSVTKSGVVRVFTQPSPASQMLELMGAKRDELGTSVATTSDHSGDAMADLIVGSPGADDTGLQGAGAATLFSSTGAVLFNVPDPGPQEGGAFGASVADIGDVNQDNVRDFLVGAPGTDLVVDGRLRVDAGRAVAISGVNGHALWMFTGIESFMDLGRMVRGGFDYRGNGVADVLIGAPGAAPRGRRGAGNARVLIASNGWPIRAYTGRRGQETRLVVIGRNDGQRVAAAFDPDGIPRNPFANVLGGASPGDLSAAVLDDGTGLSVPGNVRVVVGTGANAGSSKIAVLASDRRSKLLASFDAFPDIVGVGVNVASGRLASSELAAIVAAQADTDDGDVLVRTFLRMPGSETWVPGTEFFAYRATDQLTGALPVDAGGATVAVGDVTGDKAKEIIVGTVSGVPLVRVYSQTGALLAEWLAYDPSSVHGVNVAVTDLEADNGKAEIVTAPRVGGSLIQAFRGSGQPFVPPQGSAAVAFNAFDASVQNGVVVATADVDFDGKPEIIAAPSADGAPLIRAFELDGSAAGGFTEFEAFTSAGAALAATDHFVRR